MKLHRFYIEPDTILRQTMWLHDRGLLQQWNRVLRFRPGQELVLFDGVQHERIYRIISLNENEAELELVTETVRNLPKKEVFLFWSLLKRDKNDWVVQKCTELGVGHLVPIISARSEKKSLSDSQLERWHKIMIEATEQCGRSSLPSIRQPISLRTALDEYTPKMATYWCERNTEQSPDSQLSEKTVGVFVGPEGGWSEEEKQQFKIYHLRKMNLHNFTLRAETACAVVVAQLLQ